MLHVYVDELPALALNALERQEARAIRAHLAACPRCRALARVYATVVSLLPYAAQAQEPPAELKQRLLARLTAERAHQCTANVRQQARHMLD